MSKKDDLPEWAYKWLEGSITIAFLAAIPLSYWQAWESGREYERNHPEKKESQR